MSWPHGAMIWGHDLRHFQPSNHLKLSTHVVFKKGEARFKSNVRTSVKDLILSTKKLILLKMSYIHKRLEMTMLQVLNFYEIWLKIFFTDRPRRYFFCGSFMLFLLCVCYVFVRVCLLLSCGHLLGKG